MRNFQGIVFVLRPTYREIFKSALVYLYHVYHALGLNELTRHLIVKRLKGNTQVLIICWLLPLLFKIYTATFEVNITNHSQDIKEKQFQRNYHHINKLFYAINAWRKNISYSF